MGLLDNAKDMLGSQQAEDVTDQALQAGQDAVNKATGDKAQRAGAASRRLP